MYWEDAPPLHNLRPNQSKPWHFVLTSVRCWYLLQFSNRVISECVVFADSRGRYKPSLSWYLEYASGEHVLRWFIAFLADFFITLLPRPLSTNKRLAFAVLLRQVTEKSYYTEIWTIINRGRSFHAFTVLSVQTVFCTGTPCGPAGRDLQGHSPKEYVLDIAKMLIIIQFEIPYISLQKFTVRRTIILLLVL